MSGKVSTRFPYTNKNIRDHVPVGWYCNLADTVVVFEHALTTTARPDLAFPNHDTEVMQANSWPASSKRSVRFSFFTRQDRDQQLALQTNGKYHHKLHKRTPTNVKSKDLAPMLRSWCHSTASF